jgi:hypothetical protein
MLHEALLKGPHVRPVPARKRGAAVLAEAAAKEGGSQSSKIVCAGKPGRGVLVAA